MPSHSAAEPLRILRGNDVNGLSLLALIVIAIALVVAYRLGRVHARRDIPARAVVAPPLPEPAQSPSPPAPAAVSHDTGSAAERTRLVIAYEAEAARLRRALLARDARIDRLEDFADDRRRLYRELAEARADTARFRQIVVDLENDAPPPILGERGAPDDLKLIVGIGPVLERMLQQLGIATYRQIARWTERDIDDMDARLPEFPGRIRRDAWVVQARALHQSKYGEGA
jgi:predicted flap endonuclease-1-like 5' DNA nuclease